MRVFTIRSLRGFGFALSLAAVGECTSLVVLRTRSLGAVILGTDSLVQPPHQTSRKECKIHQVSATRFAAFSGMVQEDKPTSLDLAKNMSGVFRCN